MEKLATSEQISLSTKELVVGYGKAEPVVKNVNLEIEPGKLTILIGSNGCGKSTLLKCMLEYFRLLVVKYY